MEGHPGVPLSHCSALTPESPLSPALLSPSLPTFAGYFPQNLGTCTVKSRSSSTGKHIVTSYRKQLLLEESDFIRANANHSRVNKV